MKALVLGPFLVVSLVVSGCSFLDDLPPENRFYGLHGKVGRGTMLVAAPVGWAAMIVSLPVTLPAAGLTCLAYPEEEGGWYALGWLLGPHVCVQVTAYCVGTTMALPIHVLGEALPERVRQGRMSDEELIHHLVTRLPFVSQEEYSRLVRAAAWDRAPPYKSWDGPREVYGTKPVIHHTVADAWRAKYPAQVLPLKE